MAQRGFLRRRIQLPGLSPRSALVLLAAWSMSLLVADVGPRLRVHRPVALLHALSDCGPRQKPGPEQLLRRLTRGTTLRVRNWHGRGSGTCYHVETKEGERGYIFWDPTRIHDAGIHVGLRREWFTSPR